jgi:hypothetical protein
VNRADFEQKFRVFLSELNPDVDALGLSGSDNLFTAGALNSLDIGRVVGMLEDLRGSEIDLEGATIEAFATMDGIYSQFLA